MRVDAFQQVLDAETLAADMLHLALVLFVDGLHDKAHQHGLSLPSSFNRISCALFGRFTVAAVMMKSHISTLTQQRFAAYLTLEGVELPSSVMTNIFVSLEKFLTVAFTRDDVSPLRRLSRQSVVGEPKST